MRRFNRTQFLLTLKKSILVQRYLIFPNLQTLYKNVIEIGGIFCDGKEGLGELIPPKILILVKDINSKFPESFKKSNNILHIMTPAGYLFLFYSDLRLRGLLKMKKKMQVETDKVFKPSLDDLNFPPMEGIKTLTRRFSNC